MTLKSELKNFIEHYGWNETLDAIEEIAEQIGEQAVEIKLKK
jgi:hypothetical protein